jgi:copper chaperone CopZ
VTKALTQIDGVGAVSADYVSKRVDIEYAEDKTTLEALRAQLSEVGWEAELAG